MSGPPSADLPGPSPVPRAPAARLSGWVTGGCSLVVALVIGLSLIARGAGPIEGLDRPEASLAQLVSRQLDLRAALGQSPAWERALARLTGDLDDTLDDPLRWYAELTRAGSAVVAVTTETRLYHAILLAEAGRGADVEARVLAGEPVGEDRARLRRWLRAAYGGGPETPVGEPRALAEIQRDLAENWFRDVLAARIAARAGDATARAAAEAAMAARGAALLRRWRLLMGVELLVLLAGAAALWRQAIAGRPAALARAPVPPPWPARDGFALFVRGAFGFLALGWVPALLWPGHALAASTAGLLAGAPALVWTARYLRARGESMTATFGLGVSRADLPALARVTLALVALGLAGEALIGAAADAVGLRAHWADGLPEELIWDPWWKVTVDGADAVLWTPFVEELVFRGIVYATLRSRLSAGPAALASGIVFAAAHGYGVAGFAAVLWSSLLWAATYERTRSLLPTVLAHAANNLLVHATFVLMVRP